MPHIVMDDGSVDERTVNHERVGLDSYLLGARASSWIPLGGQLDATNGSYNMIYMSNITNIQICSRTVAREV